MKKVFPFLFTLIISVSLSAQGEEIILNSNLKLIPISDNFYIHVSNLKLQSGNNFPCNGLVYINDKKCLIVDTPTDNKLSKDLINWIKDIKNAEVIGIVPTHWHVDCAGGLKAFHDDNIISYSNKLTKDTLDMQKLESPEKTFQSEQYITVGNKKVKLFYPGPGHTRDNIVVWFDEDTILFGGCLVKSYNSKSLGYTGDAVLDKWEETLIKVKNEYPDAKIIIPGHGKPGGMELIDNSIDLVHAFNGNRTKD